MNDRRPLRGTLVALPTPFADGRLDLEAFERLVAFHARRRTSGIVVAGTTGEAPTLDGEERRDLVGAAVAFARTHARGGRRLAVVAGVGTNDTRASAENARFAEASGVDGLLVVTPYYNKPTPLGLARHFGAIANAAPRTPIVAYNVPSRTGLDLTPEAARALADAVPTVVALKEAKGTAARVRRVVRDSGLAVLAGEDKMLLPFARHGAVGAISVVANLVPDEVAELFEAPDSDRAEHLERALAPLVDALFVETNPGPVKEALSALGAIGREVRAPLAELEDGHREGLHRALVDARLLVPA